MADNETPIRETPHGVYALRFATSELRVLGLNRVPEVFKRLKTHAYRCGLPAPQNFPQELLYTVAIDLGAHAEDTERYMSGAEAGTEATTMTTDLSDIETQHPCAVNEYPAEYPSEAITTAAARQVWNYLFGEPWPEGLIVFFTNHWAPEDANAVMGDCIRPRRKIKLNWQLLNQDFERFGDPDVVLSTLVHEFIHLHDEIADHGPEFRQAFVAAYSRLRGEGVARWLCEVADAWKFLAR